MTSGNCWVVAQEPIHVGGADSSSRGNNNPIYRLPDRTPVIPASGMRGGLREHAENSPEYAKYVTEWFGGDTSNISPGKISLGWCWPVWWPVHVLGYGNWWVSCPSWLNRYQDLTGGTVLSLQADTVYVTEKGLQGKTVYLRWLKLDKLSFYDTTKQTPLPLPNSLQIETATKSRLLVVPDASINVIVDMGLVRQPRVALRDEPDANGNLVENLFAVEGIPPGTVMFLSWSSRGKCPAIEEWKQFLHSEHYIGGLWSVGYGRVTLSGH